MAHKKHGHIHHCRSSRDILSADKVISAAGLKSGDFFLDAGCGDGFISIIASNVVGIQGKVYAVDVYPQSIEMVKKEVHKKGIKNLEPVLADITDGIPLNNDSIDLCVMANVLHGFVANEEVNTALAEIKRVIKPGGIFAVVEFKKIEGTPGPPFETRITPAEVADILIQYEFEVKDVYEVGRYHYMVKAFKKKVY